LRRTLTSCACSKQTASIKLDILWREETEDDWETFTITVPKQATRGYTVAQVKSDINNLVKTHLANVESTTGGAYSAMLATLTVRASTDMPGQVMVKSTYTNGQLVCIRGDLTIAGSTAGLSSGILRTGTDTAGYWSDNGRTVSLGNVYADNQARAVTKADGTSASTPSDAERRTAALMLAIGARGCSGPECSGREHVHDKTMNDVEVVATTSARPFTDLAGSGCQHSKTRRSNAMRRRFGTRSRRPRDRTRGEMDLYSRMTPTLTLLQ
jgi:hypothetical protein